MVDLDLGGANLHSFLGVGHPDRGLNKFLAKACRRLEDAVIPTSLPNLYLIGSSDCSMEVANLFHAQKLKIIRALTRLPYDDVILDLGGGTAFNTLDFFLTSNEGIFVITPEPTAIENFFRFIKAVYIRKIKQVLKQQEFQSILGEVVEGSKDRVVRWPSDVIEVVSRRDPEKARLLEENLQAYRFRIIMNKFRKDTDESLGAKIEKVCNRHLYSDFVFVGNVPYDERVRDAIIKKQVYVGRYPYTHTATSLQEVVGKIADLEQPVSACRVSA